MKSEPRMVSTRYRTAVVIAVLALTLPMAAVAAQGARAADENWSDDPHAKDLPDVAQPHIDDAISEAELADLKTYASQAGISLESAIDRYGWTDNFALAVEGLRNGHPRAFAGAAVINGAAAWVGFVDDAPQAAVEIMGRLEKAHPEIDIQIRSSVGYSEIDLRDAVATVHYAALEATGEREVATAFDSETGQITTTLPAGSANGLAVDELRRSAVDRLRDVGLGSVLDSISVNVIGSALPKLGGTDAHIGGEGWTTCTSGFTVQHWDGRTGIATAGHCQDAQSDDGHVLTLRLQHEGQFGDMQWHTGPETEPDDFFAGSSTQLQVDQRDVAASGNPVVGQLLCKNGKNGFKDCDTVRALWTCYWIYCSLHRMEHHYAVSGDSGGPWFYGNTAYGIHHGYVWEPWADRSLFSSVTMLFQTLDVAVRK